MFILFLVYGFPRRALGVFVAAGLTDLLDGLIARHFNQRSELGTLLDPIADKTLLVSSFVVLSLPGFSGAIRIPLWLTVTVVSRDLLIVMVVLLVNLVQGKQIFRPSLLGKWTTALQVFTLFIVLLGNAWNWNLPFVEALFYVTLAFTLASGLHYLGRGRTLLD